MQVTIYPSKANGIVSAPPSKSVAHRALICGALTDGCVVKNCGSSQDIDATVRCLSALGAIIAQNKDSFTIGGFDPLAVSDDTVLDCGESGSTLRFLLPLCLLSGRNVTLIGQGRLMSRPMTVYDDLCREHNCVFKHDGSAISVRGKLSCGHYTVPGNVSSQFITGLLFALSQLTGESRVEVTGPFESASYVNITLSVFSAFGIHVRREGNIFVIPGGRRFACKEFTVEGDCSNAAFTDAFNLLGGSVKVLGLSPETPQGDWVYKQMYADLSNGKRSFDLSDCPDLGPVMFAMAAASGGADFEGTARLRLKESDRCQAMAEELKKFGITAIVSENSVSVLPGKLTPPTEILCGHNDHRIVMALSLLCSVTGGTIDGAEAVSKSYPHFFEVIQSLGIEVMRHDI